MSCAASRQHRVSLSLTSFWLMWPVRSSSEDNPWLVSKRGSPSPPWVGVPGATSRWNIRLTPREPRITLMGRFCIVWTWSGDSVVMVSEFFRLDRYRELQSS
jgi:hypothetical protein